MAPDHKYGATSELRMEIFARKSGFGFSPDRPNLSFNHFIKSSCRSALLLSLYSDLYRFFLYICYARQFTICCGAKAIFSSYANRELSCDRYLEFKKQLKNRSRATTATTADSGSEAPSI